MRFRAFGEESEQVLKFELALFIQKAIEPCKINCILVQVTFAILDLSLVFS